MVPTYKKTILSVLVFNLAFSAVSVGAQPPSTPLAPAYLQRLETQLLQSPDAIEARLSWEERWMLSKIILSLTLRGLVYGTGQLIGKVVPLDQNLGNNMKDLSEEKLRRHEMQIMNLLRSLVDRQQLRPYLASKVDLIMKEATPEEKEIALQFAAGNLESAVRTKGLTKDAQEVRYVEWIDFSNHFLRQMEKSEFDPYEIFGMQSFDQAELLVDGKASFERREKLIDGARKSLDIMVWAIYDDQTGEWLVRKLQQKLREGVRVRVVVDGQTAERKGYKAVVAKIEKLGVPVIRWMNPKALFVGMHRKMMIVDGVHMIAGGLNFGDDYSHMNPKTSQWRDTDIYLTGAFVAETSQKYFDGLWDAAVKNMRLPFNKSPIRLRVQTEIDRTKLAAMLDHDPVKFPQGSPIYLATLADLRLAEKSIDIENAYIIAIPAFVEAVRQATQRGVRVRIFTNSDQSVDEKAIGDAMKISAQRLLDAGAEVYLRKGSTLHSKFMVIDGFRSYVMSYNLHPRSEKMEGEMAIRIDNEEFGRQISAQFDQDISNPATSYRVKDRRELDVPMNLKLWLLLRLMYDQL